MGIFDSIKESIEQILGISDSWLRRIEATNLNLEICNGAAINDDETNSCLFCVALNDTIFKSNNMPDYYHYKCKVRYQLDEPQAYVDFSIKKITHYLFTEVNKTKMMKSMGYLIYDAQELYDFLYNEIKKQFLQGNYILTDLNTYGQHFKINVYLNGKRDHLNEKFLCYVGCVAYPFGKIKVATPLVKINKEGE